MPFPLLFPLLPSSPPFLPSLPSGVSAAAISYLAMDVSFPEVIRSLEGVAHQHPALWTSCKFLVALPFTYHLLNGTVRHLVRGGTFCQGVLAPEFLIEYLSMHQGICYWMLCSSVAVGLIPSPQSQASFPGLIPRPHSQTSFPGLTPIPSPPCDVCCRLW